ncbi:amino acid ABC transporter permease [Halalkalibacterium halodurans]|jgi:polar amino acid transport system permease protein|uniref:amino acid ABC transporter permease n=1 Tax=Halalkalibacterium halodurans TaxID=86665 RepID=UPI001067564B|nr:amino acid ABC transporter permease [Halalkalibacterium halodurans]MDY7221983.1 amino acid ABC transporter permease [Halalkalibacterium halodurans]MDY7241259.1 amino acid ABC transporter permease [Halalkalibacterium halodurans]MED3648840.1 amino acid ABC transporter permease [Halalkalibacterium halodurans]MED4162961.1 amino acid ABC transporter permease [Halalkalibacterium halodurans]TES55005.1 amino acid ABC transporter permease [Halalkalibacterium halodurans]
MSFDFSRIQPFMPFMLEGVWVTLQFVSVSLLFGLVLGIVLAIFKISKYRLFRWFADFYTSIFRGTPLILQLLMIYLALPQFGVDISQFQAAFLAFGLNSAAYVSEIIRAGIQAVDKGQREAAEALGIPYRPMMLRIILPQAMRNILPALFNEFINLTKESAIVSVIGVTDLMRRAQITSAETYLYFEPLLFVGLIYYVLVMGLTVIGRLLERRLKRSD